MSFKQHIYSTAKQELRLLTRDAASDINTILTQAMSSAEQLADSISQGKTDKHNMHAQLKQLLTGNPNYFGASITYAPFGYSPRTRLYSAYYSRQKDTQQLAYTQLDKVYDYTTSEYDWYVEPMRKGNRWSEPYWDEAGKTYLTTYSAIFYREEPTSHTRIANGVVTIDISMQQIRQIIESLSIGASGFGALTTQEGNYLYHPNYEYVLSHKNLRDIAQEKNDDDRLKLAEMAANRRAGLLEHISTTTGQNSWLIFEPIATSGWSLQNTFLVDDIKVDVDSLRKQLVWIVIAAIAFLISLSFILLKVNKGTIAQTWFFSALSTIFLLIGISTLWGLALAYHNSDDAAGIRIADKTKLDTITQNFNRHSIKKHLSPPIYIPTGINIETLNLQGSSDVSISGTIWQKYPTGSTEQITPGFQFGHARDVRIERVSTETVNGYEITRWRYQADIRVQLDYSRYPLEIETIALKIAPQESNNNIVLIPDLDAYKILAPTLLPGLDDSAFILGWDLTESYFSLKQGSQLTNFGVSQNIDQDTFPDLYYVIGIKRIFVDAFISNLTPLIVVTIILFAISLLPPSIDISRILGICVSVFFVVVFAHLAIRRNISIGEIFYLEYFFFVIYLAILLVPMNAFRTSLGLQIHFFDYHNGLLPKAIYWPSIMGIFFIITALKFY